MDISIIISGNLTGFSRFYASPNANDIYSEAKFDFDYRNFLTFLNAGEKAYSISFSPKVIAVSLITRVLDSFRRPGILVVTALIPRYQVVSGTLNAQDKSAIYRLLNEINDKFYEKNFMNGMVNQNPAVLMQDYYSDILRNYTLVSDKMQRAINTTIEVNSPNKRIGYVAACEEDMPKYLSSLMRKLYNGYHHVFFADKAPQNIDEPADEIVKYKVKISNDDRLIQGEVRLDDRIPYVSPQQGEMPIRNQNYTYRQVLNREAGNDILASIQNDTIVLKYCFRQEEKTIYFKFYYGTNEVPLHLIHPVIEESDGSSYSLSTNSWTFRGKEIYGNKTIKSGNSEYIVESDCSHIDLQRLRDGMQYNVYINKGWTWNFYPHDTLTGRRVSIKPVDIELKNRRTGISRKFSHVTGAVSEPMPGDERDWIMEITSDYYDPITSAPNGGDYTFVPKRQPSYGDEYSRADVQKSRTHASSQGHSSSNESLTSSKSTNYTAKERVRIEAEKKKRLLFYCIFVVGAIICSIVGWWAYTKFIPTELDEKNIGKQIAANKATKKVSFRFLDYDKDELKDVTIEKLDISFGSDSVVSKSEDGKSYIIAYNPTANPSQKVKIIVSFQDINMLEKEFQNIFEIQALDSIIDIPLSVKTSDINVFETLEKGIKPKRYDDYRDKIIGENGIISRNKEYGELLINKLGNKPDNTGTQKESESKGDENNGAESKIPADLDGIDLTVDELNKKVGKEYESDPAKQRITTLKSILTGFKTAKVPTRIDNLSREQKKIVNNLFEINKKINESKDSDLITKFQNQLKNCKSLKHVENYIITRVDSFSNKELNNKDNI